MTARPSAGELLCCATTMTAGSSSLKGADCHDCREAQNPGRRPGGGGPPGGAGGGVHLHRRAGDAWEPLSEEELAYFNGDSFFNGDYLNIRNQFLSSTYAAPEEIDLFQIFYCGDGDADYAAPPDGVDPVALEAAMLAAEGGDAPDCPATILTTAQMDKVLRVSGPHPGGDRPGGAGTLYLSARLRCVFLLPRRHQLPRLRHLHRRGAAWRAGAPHLRRHLYGRRI